MVAGGYKEIGIAAYVDRLAGETNHHASRGRPRQDAAGVKQPQVKQEARRKACFIVATNVLDSTVLSEQEVVTICKEQGKVERGFRFLRISVVSGLLRVPQKP